MPHAGGSFKVDLVEDTPGFVQLVISGRGAKDLFGQESGGHRWQRVPPTEKRGRVQTSTVTVAVLDPDTVVGKALNQADVEITTVRGGGPGGQHRNKTESCVVATHRPTGMSVRIDMRSQHQSRAMALKVLAARLYEQEKEKVSSSRANERKVQVGSGQRGDKVRTYRTQDDQVTDHRTGKKWRLAAWQRGEW